MPNNLELIKKYIDKLDEVYRLASLTADLESDASMVRQGDSTHTILIPKRDMDGLGDYDRTTGYADGNVSLEWIPKEFNYDRGRRFTVDAMDNEETAGISFGLLASGFIRDKVVPEMDAWRFATYAKNAGTVKTEEFTIGEDICTAIKDANTLLDEAEVPTEGRYLFITPGLDNTIQSLDSYKSKSMIENFTKIIRVPTSRFYTAIDLLDGRKDDELAGGYKKNESGKTMNFMIVHKDAPIQFTKHNVNKIITPEANQTTDGWLYFYRAYGLTDVFENKKNGIYVSVATK